MGQGQVARGTSVAVVVVAATAADSLTPRVGLNFSRLVPTSTAQPTFGRVGSMAAAAIAATTTI